MTTQTGGNLRQRTEAARVPAAQQEAATSQHAQQRTHVYGLLQQWKPAFAEMLPSHVNIDAWILAAWTAVDVIPSRGAKTSLIQASSQYPDSLKTALGKAARWGLEPGTDQYYLSVRSGMVQGITGYQGEIELMYRAGAVSTIIVNTIRENDLDNFEYVEGVTERPIFRRDWKQRATQRGDLVLTYAYAIMKDGATSKVVILDRDDITRIRSTSASDNIWNQHTEAMWMKSAIHQLRKWVPTSAEYVGQSARVTASTVLDVERRGIQNVAAAQVNAAQAREVESAQQRPAIEASVDQDTGEITGDVVVEEPPGWEQDQ